MSLRDEFEKEYGKRPPEPEPYSDDVHSLIWDSRFEGYQSATERALRIGLDVHAWASARNLNWNTVLTEYERRLKGGDNGN